MIQPFPKVLLGMTRPAVECGRILFNAANQLDKFINFWSPAACCWVGDSEKLHAILFEYIFYCGDK
jgi:hypothetical protein